MTKKTETPLYVKCNFDHLVDPKSLTPSPKNPNKHSKKQIDAIAKVLRYQGIRKPIIVSKLDSTVVTGHGTLEAAKKLDWKFVPISYQDFENEDQQYAHLVADNTLSRRSELDFSMVNMEIPSLDPGFDIDCLGIDGFTIDPSERDGNAVLDPSGEWAGMPEFDQGDKTSFRHVVIHFRDEKDAEEFFSKIGHNDTGKTRSMWYPPQENLDTISRRYEEE